MKIKVSSSYTGAISTGPYENARPGFTAEIEYEINDPIVDQNEVNRQINVAQLELHHLCYDNFKACERMAIMERINKERIDFRWYKDDEENDIPSVNSIINFDADMFVKPDELQQYASQSNLCHGQVAHYIDKKKWVEPKEIPDLWTDIVIVTKGSLRLELDGWDFPAFLEKYPIKELKNTKPSVNLVDKYGGTPDFEGIPSFKDAESVPTLCDVKRTVDKVKNFKQLAAYAKMRGYEHIKQLMIVPLNNKTKQGFSVPVVTTKIDEYYKMFLRDREAFKKRYGI